MKFETACFHPNVDQYGNICLDILKDKWSAAYSVRTILLSLQSLLGEPNNDSPLNAYAAKVGNPVHLKRFAYNQLVSWHLQIACRWPTFMCSFDTRPRLSYALHCHVIPIYREYVHRTPEIDLQKGVLTLEVWGLVCSCGRTRQSTGECCTRSTQSCRSSGALRIGNARPTWSKSL